MIYFQSPISSTSMIGKLNVALACFVSSIHFPAVLAAAEHVKEKG
jgi:hypothetical protein